MGFVQREIDNLFVRTDNFQVVDDKDKIKELALKNLIKNRKGKLIIIYTENDFREFYKKHCQKTPNDNKEFTIIVEDEVNIPEKEIIRKIIEKILENKNNYLRDDKSIINKISIVNYKVKSFFDFNEKSRDGFIRFRDIDDNVKIKDLDELYNKKIISEKEYEKIKSIYNSSIQNKKFVKEMWLIGHTDVI